MDKYDIVLDLVEHPDRYTPEQTAQVLSDPEVREIYNLLSRTASACKASEEVADAEVDAEWRRLKPRPRLRWYGSRAASIAVFALSSLVAVAIGVAVTVGVIKEEPKPAGEGQEQAVAAQQAAAIDDTAVAETDTVPSAAEPVLFEDAPLGDILEAVSAAYGVTVSYRTPDAAGLHLHYKLDPALQLSEIVEQLNTFERLNIRLDGETIIVD